MWEAEGGHSCCRLLLEASHSWPLVPFAVFLEEVRRKNFMVVDSFAPSRTTTTINPNRACYYSCINSNRGRQSQGQRALSQMHHTPRQDPFRVEP